MCVNILILSLGNFDIEHFWFLWILYGNFLFLKYIKFYATGFVHVQYKCITAENLNITPNCWKSTAGNVGCYTHDAMTQIHKMK